MTYRGLSNWPPVWVRSSRGPYAKITGEVGTLTDVKWYDLTANRCFLLMEFQSERYMGSLIFDDAAFCRQIYDLLQDHIGESIIGSDRKCPLPETNGEFRVTQYWKQQLNPVRATKVFAFSAQVFAAGMRGAYT